jgi:antitoxin CptB
MSDSLDMRRRRASYRAAHRGTKEMDILMGRYAEAHLGVLDEDGIEHFERFLAVADPVLQGWILHASPVDDAEFSDLVRAIRTFHGLES